MEYVRSGIAWSGSPVAVQPTALTYGRPGTVVDGRAVAVPVAVVQTVADYCRLGRPPAVSVSVRVRRPRHRTICAQSQRHHCITVPLPFNATYAANAADVTTASVLHQLL